MSLEIANVNLALIEGFSSAVLGIQTERLETKPVRKVITVTDPLTKKPRNLTIIVDDGLPAKPKYVPKERGQGPVRRRHNWDDTFGNTTNEPGSHIPDD